MFSDWQRQGKSVGLTGSGRAASGDFSRLLVATSRVASINGLSREISGQWDGDSVCSGGSPHRGAGRGHR